MSRIDGNPSSQGHVRSHAPSDRNRRIPRKIRTLPHVGEVFNPNGMFNGIWIPESLLRCSGISPSAKLLYGRLARFAGQDGRCFPAIETLAAELGMTDRQVQRLIAQLCGAGFLRKDVQYRPNGSQTANAYVFLYHVALAPAPAVEPTHSQPAHPERRQLRREGDINVTGGVTSASPLEDSQLNSDSVKDSSSTAQSHPSVRPAADPDPGCYPRSSARFRECFPRITLSVVVRILRAICAVCPDATDEDITAAVYLEPDQHSPGLWVHTMPDQVRKVIERRMAATSPSGPNCPHCGDAGVIWDEPGRAAWCPAGCEAAEEQRHRNGAFVDEWNSQMGQNHTAMLDHRSSSPASGGPSALESG